MNKVIKVKYTIERTCKRFCNYFYLKLLFNSKLKVSTGSFQNKSLGSNLLIFGSGAVYGEL